MSALGTIARVSARRFEGYTRPQAAELLYEAVLARAQREGRSSELHGKPGFEITFGLKSEANELFPDFAERTRANLVTALTKSGNAICTTRRYGQLSTWWISATLLKSDVMQYVARNGRTPDQHRTRAADEPLAIVEPLPDMTDPLSAIRNLLAAAEEAEKLRAENARLREKLAAIATLLEES
jgi:hypothetical protein